MKRKGTREIKHGVHNGQFLSPNTVMEDLELAEVCDNIPTSTQWGKQCILKRLQSPTADPVELKRLQLVMMSLRLDSTVRMELQTSLQTVNEALINDCIENQDERVTESVEQILWKDSSMGSFLNQSSLYLNAIVVWKTLLLPCIAVLMPIVSLVVPYIFLRYKQPSIDMSAYLERMKTVILKQITVPVVLRSRSEHDVLGFLLERLFIGITLATFIASLWNQITPAIHLRHIWNELTESGKACMDMLKWLQRIKELCVKPTYKRLVEKITTALDPVEHLLHANPVAVYAYFRSHRDQLTGLKELVGFLDATFTLAGTPGICFPRYGKHPKIVGLRHPLLQDCVKNSVDTKTPHILLTGPNRGGKSTFLKAYGLAIVTSLSWGFAWADKCTVPLYKKLHISLTPAPVLGKSSTFEAEIDVARTICECTESPQFVMMDEIFHSTNAADGSEATRIFLERLYSKQNVTSIISTHYHDVVTKFTKNVTHLMMETANVDDTIVHKYHILHGINRHSTVMEILKERGLLKEDAFRC